MTRSFVPGVQDVRVCGALTPLGCSQVSNLSSAKALGAGVKADSSTLGIPAAATIATIEAETKDVRWTDDGQTPTSSFGQTLYAGQVMSYEGDLSALKFIEVAASAKLNLAFYSKASP